MVEAIKVLPFYCSFEKNLGRILPLFHRKKYKEHLLQRGQLSEEIQYKLKDFFVVVNGQTKKLKH